MATESEAAANEILVVDGAVHPGLGHAMAWVFVGSVTASILTKAPGSGLVQFFGWMMITGLTFVLSLPLAGLFSALARRKWLWALPFSESYRVVAVSQFASMIPPMLFTAVAPGHLVGDIAIATGVSAVGNSLSPLVWASMTIGGRSIGWLRARQAAVVVVGPLLLVQIIWLFVMKFVLKT